MISNSSSTHQAKITLAALLLALTAGFSGPALAVGDQPLVVASPAVSAAKAQTEDTMKSFLAGMTYNPKASALPDATEIRALVDELQKEMPKPEEPVVEEPEAPVKAASASGAILNTSPIRKALSFLMPVANAVVSSHFGVRWGKMHDGVDLAVNAGTPIKAAEGGKVTISGWQGGYGNFVAIDHGGGFVTRYGHASRLLVKKGQQVSKGQVIALVGSTGHSTGPHLHFEVASKGRYLDPLTYLNRVITIASR